MDGVARLLFLALTASTLALDLILKAWARANLPGAFDPLLPGLITLTLTYNTGAAWSLFSNSALPLAWLRLTVGLGLLAYAWWKPLPNATRLSLALIGGGALGNALDGLMFGRVTDMLFSPALSAVTRALGQGDFPVFNLADVWVVSGVLLLLAANVMAGKRPSNSPV